MTRQPEDCSDTSSLTGAQSIGNERKAVLSRTQLENHGIMQYITDVS